uniref:TROVE domain-containing protein n=1 Tax=Aegilops tauschii subsp. strangulata TaxID=200361 RepID=A0A452ZN16_AEGTS
RPPQTLAAMATETEPAAAPRLLLGPPLIRAARPSPDSAAATSDASHPFLDLLDAAFNAPSPAAIKAALKPRRALTENCSATYANSGNPCLDFFFQVVPDTPADRVRQLLAAAWAQDAPTALRLACNLRGVRGTGKSDREGFYAAALWMHEHHPRTLACNVAALAEFGYLKDFPELLFRLLRGPDVRAVAKAGAEADKARRKAKGLATQREGLRARLAGRKRARELALVPAKATFGDFLSAALSKAGKGSKPVESVPVQEPPEVQKPEAMEVDQKKTAAGKPRRMSKKVRTVAKLAMQSLETYYGDRAYRFLFDAVADFFAALLTSDLQQLASGGKKRKIGLAAKWCPTPGSSFDRTTLLCEAIARRLFPRDSDPELTQLSDEHYAYHALHRLRRKVLVPLRKVLELPEVYMSAQRWSELPYTRVASVAMRRYKSLFKKHDEERFDKYLEDVEAGKAKIAAGALLPHEIAAAAYRGQDDNVSELSEEPWAGKVITFSENPEIHLIKGKTLRQKMDFVRRMHWAGSTNFQGVFDQILRTAVEASLAPEKMIRTVFVYSDMEFNMASGSAYAAYYSRRESVPWETDYEVICKKFRDAGYGDVVPQIIFWNLRDSKSTPVTSTQPGVAMVSGFSKNFLKIFLKNDGVVNPEAIMMEAIAGEEYQKLVVYD